MKEIIARIIIIGSAIGLAAWYLYSYWIRPIITVISEGCPWYVAVTTAVVVNGIIIAVVYGLIVVFEWAIDQLKEE